LAVIVKELSELLLDDPELRAEPLEARRPEHVRHEGEGVVDAVGVAAGVEGDAVPIRRCAQVAAEVVGGEADGTSIFVTLGAAKDHVLKDVREPPGLIVLVHGPAAELNEDVAARVVRQGRTHHDDAVVEAGRGVGLRLQG
jgi:hypothetical protein